MKNQLKMMKVLVLKNLRIQTIMKIPNNVTKRIGQIMNFMWKLEPNPVAKEQVEIEFELLTSSKL